MSSVDSAALALENAALRQRLQEFEDTLASMQRGEVDALIVNNAIYTLDSANDAAHRLRRDVLSQMEDSVFAFDAQDHVIFVNAAAERRYATTWSQALGRHRQELFVEGEIPPEFDAGSGFVDIDATPARRALSTHTLPDGTCFHVETRMSPLTDANGTTVGSLAVIRDVSERLHAERLIAEAAVELAGRERQFATLVENAPDIFSRLGRDRRYLYMSPVVEKYSNLSASAYLGRTNEELGMPEALCRQWNDALQQVFADARIAVIKFALPGRDARVSTFETRLVPERSATGRVESVLSIASDITEREALDATLRAADRQKDEFLATLAHELRNPLAPIGNAIQIMRMTDDEAMQENARSIVERQLRQLVHLVDDLLDVSRISQGKVELRREVLDVVDIVNMSVETSRPLIDRGRHRLRVSLPRAGVLHVHGDSTRLAQTLSNLLNNAAKYTPSGGSIELVAERAGDEVLLSVRDSGVGIARDALPRVFDMFTQVGSSLSHAQGGLGIGLALVRSLVAMHGGSVRAESAGIGRGSRFSVRLPLVDGQASAKGEDTHRLSGDEGRRRTVLVVDDNLDSADTMSEILQMMGYETLVGHDGAAALRLWESHHPDAVVLDIGLPVMTGHEVARRIRALPRGDEVLLIAVSGWGQDHDQQRSRDSGFDHHFVKPVDLQPLTALIAAGRVGA